MPTYTLQCPVCGPQDTIARMSDAAAFMECPVCTRPRPQVYYPPQFVEDRVRLWRGPNGDRYSYALGGPMPESRKERDRLAAAKGVEFVGKSEFLASNKEAAEAVAYHEHVSTGGDRIDKPPEPAPRDVWKKDPAWAKGLT